MPNPNLPSDDENPEPVTGNIRIVHICGAKIRPPWYILLDYFTTRPYIKKLNLVFFTKWPEMGMFRFLIDGLVVK